MLSLAIVDFVRGEPVVFITCGWLVGEVEGVDDQRGKQGERRVSKKKRIKEENMIYARDPGRLVEGEQG